MTRAFRSSHQAEPILRSRVAQLLDATFCAALLMAQGVGWGHVAASSVEGPAWWWMGALSVGAWLAADAASGLAHYAADNWGSPRTPLLGRTFIAPFRHHHEAPNELLRHGPLELNGNNCLLAALSIAWVPHIEATRMTLPLMVFALQVSLWASLTNQIHAWAHRADVPWPIQTLQHAGLLLSPAHHARHHAHFVRSERDRHGDAAPARAQAYCITSGVWDRLGTLVGGALRRPKRVASVAGTVPHELRVD